MSTSTIALSGSYLFSAPSLTCYTPSGIGFKCDESSPTACEYN